MEVQDDNKKSRRFRSNTTITSFFRQRQFQTKLAIFFLILIGIYLNRKVIHELIDFNEDACPSIRRGDTEPGKICFISSVFGQETKRTDRPSDVTDLIDCSRYRFFLFTNLWRLNAPGWTKILRYDLRKYSRMITQSRWGKFLAWQEPRVADACRVVFYMDGYVKPKLEMIEKFERIAEDLTEGRAASPFLAQVLHPSFNGQSMEEIFHGILIRHKDLPENTNITFEWLQSQPDFKSHIPYYLNKYFAYNPRSRKFRNLSKFFWDHYSNETGSWRDQPLWAYALHHFNITPLVLTTEGDIEKGGDLFKHGGGMGWQGHVYGKESP